MSFFISLKTLQLATKSIDIGRQKHSYCAVKVLSLFNRGRENGGELPYC